MLFTPLIQFHIKPQQNHTGTTSPNSNTDCCSSTINIPTHTSCITTDPPAFVSWEVFNMLRFVLITIHMRMTSNFQTRKFCQTMTIFKEPMLISEEAHINPITYQESTVYTNYMLIMNRSKVRRICTRG